MGGGCVQLLGHLHLTNWSYVGQGSSVRLSIKIGPAVLFKNMTVTDRCAETFGT